MSYNRKFNVTNLICAVLSLVSGAYIFYLNRTAGVIALSTSLIVIALYIIHNAYRYSRIKKLSVYLTRMISGDFSMDIRDNTEGELSVLKNNIYKITLMLIEKNDMLYNERKFLADSLANISHQLKTPLTSISVMTDLLKSGDLTDEKRFEFTENIRKQIDRMEWLLTSLLKLSKLDAGVVEFNKTKIKMTEIIKKASMPVLIPMELKNQTLEIVCGEEIELETDGQWTSEAVLNVLKNCVEHTACGGKIRIICTDTPIYTKLVICDNGKGIDKDDIPHLFERFYKGKNSAPESAGIGLSMTRSILKAQNADISVKSVCDGLAEGAEFTVYFRKTVI